MATLIIRHPRSGMLFVNFDREIMQLVRESKFLQRMGMDVPETARMVLLQESKFKWYYDELTFALKEYERVLALVPPVCKPVIRPHLEDLDRKIHPGMVLLTWQSMNIDGYLHRVHTGVALVESLMHKINDIMVLWFLIFALLSIACVVRALYYLKNRCLVCTHDDD